jgi:hypothetical protein
MFTGPQQTLTLKGNLGSPQTMPTEADTGRKLAVPKLQAAGWDNEPHSITAQRWFDVRCGLKNLSEA